jgi:SAM-dependent methyltransferase
LAGEDDMKKYVHGYSERESQRLHDQAGALDELLHHDSVFTEGSAVLEAGSGVGSQTRIIARKNPGCRFTSVDISADSIKKAEAAIKDLGIRNVTFRVADIYSLPFEAGSFDHVFVCFTLEHLPDPLSALRILKGMVRPGGTVTVIEGDHGSAYFHPRSDAADRVISCQVRLQAMHGGNALIGRELYPLLCEAGFTGCVVSPRMVYVDSGRPELVEGFTRNTFTAMIEGVEEDALDHGLIDKVEWDRGIQGLHRTAENDGVFCYTFFKGKGVNA